MGLGYNCDAAVAIDRTGHAEDYPVDRGHSSN